MSVIVTQHTPIHTREEWEEAVWGLVGEFSSVGVHLPSDASEEDGLRILERMETLVNKAGPFWIGDACVFLQETHGLSQEKIALRLNRPVSTLKKYVRLARGFDECRRRHFLETMGLSISHLLEVLVFHTVAEREHWLNQAAQEGWAVKPLRKQIAAVTKPFDEEEEMLPVSVGALGEDEDGPEEAESGHLTRFMADVPVPQALTFPVDAETMEALRRSQSSPVTYGSIRPPVLLPGRGLWVATFINRNLDTGVDTALCARVSDAQFYHQRWEAEGLPEPLRHEDWREAHPEGAGGLSGLLVHANPGPGEYVFLGETATFVHHAGEVETPENLSKKSSDPENVSKSEPEIGTSAEYADTGDLSEEPETGLMTGLKVYLAARYSRRVELCDYAEHLLGQGFTITSRWLEGDHQISDEGLSVEAKAEERTRFAMEDWEDLMAADVCINFTETPRGTNSRGGRHVEFGAALASGKRVVVIGHRENVFHCLPIVEFYESWEDFCQTLKPSPVPQEAPGEPEEPTEEALEVVTQTLPISEDAPACADCASELAPSCTSEDLPRKATFDPNTRVWVQVFTPEPTERPATVQAYRNGSVFVCFEDDKTSTWKQEAHVRPMEEPTG